MMIFFVSRRNRNSVSWVLPGAIYILLHLDDGDYDVCTSVSFVVAVISNLLQLLPHCFIPKNSI